MVFAKRCSGLAHGPQINKLTDAHPVYRTIAHCTYALVSLLVQLCNSNTLPIDVFLQCGEENRRYRAT